MRNRKAVFLASLVFTSSLSASAAAPEIVGLWTTRYQIIDVRNSTATDPSHLKALKMWIGHRYGGQNCVKSGDTSNLLRSLYPWDSRAKSAVTFNDFAGFTTINRYSGGFAIPGQGTETITGVIEGDHISGIVDIDLDWEGGTHVRAVLSATRSGPCN